jgi:hypothetical protein
VPLLSFWRSNREAVLGLTIEQVVSNAGDGNLRESGESSKELRDFLRIVPVEQLFAYARHCLESPFSKSGLALQDIVNEFGRRLEFEVENGPYQGTHASIGFDGIWRSEGEPEVIVEVKSSDAYRISLDTVARYKEKLVSGDRVQRNASVLIVVGREDTGELEAQVRGSRYAWDMRLISIEGLIKLVQVKEKSEESATLNQIRQLLRPFEYTKLDGIIDVIFTTTVDVEDQSLDEEEAAAEAPDDAGIHQVHTDPELLDAKRLQVASVFFDLKRKEILKRSRALLWSPDRDFRVCCTVSKRYQREGQPYWYGFRRQWDDFLAGGKESYLILSCMDREDAYALPYKWIDENKKNLSMTHKGDRSYWHIALTLLGDNDLALNFSKVGTKASLEPFRFKLD